MKRAAMLLLMAGVAVAALAAGCTSVRVGDRDLLRQATAPGLDTKAAVVRRLGGPDAVATLDDGSQILTYGNVAVRGGGLIVSYYAPLLSIQRTNRRGDIVQFTLAPDGKVTQVRVVADAGKANGSIWPFSP